MLNLLALATRNNGSMGKGNGGVINMDTAYCVLYVRGWGSGCRNTELGVHVARLFPGPIRHLNSHEKNYGPYFPPSLTR